MAACVASEAALARHTRFAMHDAAEKDDVATLTRLLDAEDADPDYMPGRSAAEPLGRNDRDNLGCTPLHVATLYAARACFRLLVTRGAKLNSKCNGSPLSHLVLSLVPFPALAAFVSEAVAALAPLAKLDLTATDDVGRSWLHAAAAVDAVDAADAWFAAMSVPSADGSAVGARSPAQTAMLAAADRYGRTPAHAAATAGCARMLLWLQSRGAPIAAVDMRGDTPAHCAARHGHRQVLDQLLAWEPAAGAVENASGVTPSAAFIPHATAGEGGAAAAAPAQPRTLLVTDPCYMSHHTCMPAPRPTWSVPPENVGRLDTLLSPINGTLRSADLAPRLDVISEAPPARMSDVLQVHEYEYVRRIIGAAGAAAPDAAAPDGAGIRTLDGDTTLSHGSWEAALRAAGAACLAVDSVVAGRAHHAFCAVRPPGHHAGPSGIVPCPNNPEGSHGFCLLNNVAIAAAYARRHVSDARYAASGGASSGGEARPPRCRIAIIDFDVHHGNGTEAIIRNLVPSEVVTEVMLPWGRGLLSRLSYKPWLDDGDGGDVMFVSSHGYGLQDPAKAATLPPGACGPSVGPWFYPGSGGSCGWDAAALPAAAAAAAAAVGSEGDAAVAGGLAAPSLAGSRAAGVGGTLAVTGEPVTASLQRWSAEAEARAARAAAGSASTIDPPAAAAAAMAGAASLHEAGVAHPFVINVALPHGTSPRTWRRIMTAQVLPRVAAFAPHLIFISAGFDAHHKDEINHGYLALREDDYEWVTAQIVKIANACCPGRIVSVLEGGYRIHGRTVSAFGRSVAAHVRALSSGCTAVWDTAAELAQLQRELVNEARAEAARAATAAATAAMPRELRALLLTAETPRLSKADSFQSAASGDSGGGAYFKPLRTPLPSPLAELASPPPSVAAMRVGVSSSSAGDGFGGGTPVGEALAGSKRRRAAVDYAALDAKLKAEAKAMPTPTTPMAAPAGEGAAGTEAAGGGDGVDAAAPPLAKHPRLA